MLSGLRDTMLSGQLSLAELVEKIFTDQDIRRIFFLSPVNYEFLKKSDALLEADLILVDSVSLAKVLNVRWGTRLHRYSFDNSSLAPHVYAHANELRMSVAVIGATEHDNDVYCDRLMAKYPQIRLVMRQNGYFNSDERPAILRRFKELRPDIAIVGMGTPAQEELCNALIPHSGQKIFTCGGHISQSSRSWDYYPPIVNRTHMRWLYRLIKEPHTRRRLFKVMTGLARAWKEAHA